MSNKTRRINAFVSLSFLTLGCLPIRSSQNMSEIIGSSHYSMSEDFDLFMLEKTQEAPLGNQSTALVTEARMSSENSDQSLVRQIDLVLDNESAVPLPINEAVQKWIDFFQFKHGSNFQAWLDRGNAYRPMILRTLQKYDLPEELIHLAMIESGFSYNARSYRRATGMWQLMRGTARRYGLVVNKWLDERRDPQLATEAACKLLSNLYQEFGDWHLSLAAYNAGDGKVRNAIRKTGTRDYWEIINTKALRRETREFVPKFIAATLISQNPEQYGFRSDQLGATPLPDHKLFIDRKVTLPSLAKSLKISVATLKIWNPAIRKSTLYGTKKKPIALRVESHIVAECDAAFCRNENIM